MEELKRTRAESLTIDLGKNRTLPQLLNVHTSGDGDGAVEKRQSNPKKGHLSGAMLQGSRVSWVSDARLG